MNRFLQSARLAYDDDKKGGTKDKDEVEAGGSMFGDLARVVVHKYKES